MPIIGWIRDLFGIQKDMYETKKTRLEIEQILEEKREKLITRATLEDVKKYDPKIQKLLIKIIENRNIPLARRLTPISKSQLERIGRILIKERQKRKRRIVALTLLIAALLFASMLIYMLAR